MDFKQFYKTVQFDIDNEIRTVFQATQGDTKSRGLLVDLIVGGVKTPITTEKMTFFALKPDGTRVMTVGVKEGTGFRIDFTNQTFAVPGVLLCTLVLSGTNGEKIADKKFKMTVDSSLEDGAIISEDERGILDRAFDLASDIVPRLEGLDVPLLENLEQEVILARGAEPTLGARLDATDAQLAETATRIDNILKKSTNLFNHNFVHRNKFISSTTGELQDSTQNFTSDFIEVKPSQNYTFIGFTKVGYYDENKNFIKITEPLLVSASITIPSNVKYIRLQYPIAEQDVLQQINEGDTLLPYEPYYLKLESETKSDGNNINEYLYSGNLFNEKTALKDYTFDNVTGEARVAATYSLSDFIEIEETSVYSYEGFPKIAYYDKDKLYLGRVENHSYANITGKLPRPGTKFVRVSYEYANPLSVNRQVKKGSTLIPYEPYGGPILKGISSEAEDIKLYQDIQRGFIPLIETSSNLFIGKDVRRHKALDSLTGELKDSPMYSVTGFIEIEPSTAYSYNGFNKVIYYDQNKNYLGIVEFSYLGLNKVSPANTKYIRAHWQTAVGQRQQINKGSTLEPYEPYHFYLHSDVGIKPNKVGKVMSDVPMNGVFSTSEIHSGYTNFGSGTKTSDVYALFDDLMAANPEYITREHLGNEATGLPVYAYHLNPELPTSAIDRDLPTIYLVCGLHGYEHASTLSTYLMVKEMCEKWEVYPLLEALRFNCKFIIIPVANPYGWNAYIRHNSNGVDLNRNFPFEWQVSPVGTNTYGGASPLSELESQYIASVFNNHDIDMMFDFHNFGEGGEVEYFLWIPSSSGELISNLAQCFISRMSRKWQQDFNFIPKGTFIGYASASGDATLQNYAQSLGILQSATFEVRSKWMLDPNGTSYDANMAKAGLEAIVNWLLINLNETIN